MSELGEPLADSEFKKLLKPFALEGVPLAVGVSGGGDSMCLAALVHKNHNGSADYLIVDHRFRSESAAEARFAAAELERLGIADNRIHILTADRRPEKKTQEAARQLRFAAFAKWCRGNAVFELALAHHLDDQAETLLGRLSRGSGVQGLAAMRAVSYRADFRLLRPLLAVGKRRLTATAAEYKIRIVDDRSNRSSKYLRTRLRRVLGEEGATPERLATTAVHLGRAAAAINRQVAKLGGECCKFPPQRAVIDPPPLIAAPQEVALRLLERVLVYVGGGKLRFASLERLYRLIAAGPFAAQTLNRCKIGYRATAATEAAADVDGDSWGRRGLVIIGKEGKEF